MSQSSSAVHLPVTPQQPQDTNLPEALPPGTPDEANQSEPDQSQPVLNNRAATNSSVEIVDEVNQPPKRIVEHSAPEKSDRSSSASSVVILATEDDEIASLKKAAMQGDAGAQFELAKCYLNGDGVEENQEEAFECCHKAAMQGHAEAQRTVGNMYEEGEGVKVDKEKALYWYHMAAEQGELTAQFNLGLMYDDGEGVEENQEKAFEWYHKAADQGDSQAQFNLGCMYANGSGVAVNKEKAFEWYLKAAEQGELDAMEHLCSFYIEGQGVEKNLPLATYWMLRKSLDTDGKNIIVVKYSQLFEFMPSVLTSYSEFEKVNSIKFDWHEFYRGDYFSHLAKFIKFDSKIKFLSLNFSSKLSDAKGNTLVEALKFNTQLTGIQFPVYQPSEEIATQIQALLIRNKHIAELRQYVVDLHIEKTPGFPLDIVKVMVDKMIVAYLKDGQTKEATKIAIDEMLITAGIKPLEEDAKIT